MPRLPAVDRASLPPASQAVYDEIVRVRGQVRGPFAIWLASPELCRRALDLQDWFPKHASLERRLLELMILILARRANAEFAWFVHEGHALRLGIGRKIVEAIRAGLTPAFDKADEQLVWDVTVELDTTRALTPETYDRAVGLLGPAALVEFVAATGFYVMVAMTLNAFEAPVPGGARPFG